MCHFIQKYRYIVKLHKLYLVSIYCFPSLFFYILLSSFVLSSFRLLFFYMVSRNIFIVFLLQLWYICFIDHYSLYAARIFV